MSLSNSFGVAALLPALPDCDFKRYVTERVAQGVLSGWADTEPGGAANWLPSTRAVSQDGGKTYVINGDKCYIGNGSVADLLIVSVTIEQDGVAPDCALFAVETNAPGFTVHRNHDFMGIRGAPIAALRFKDVVVERKQMLEIPEKHWRNALLIEPISALGRALAGREGADAVGRVHRVRDTAPDVAALDPPAVAAHVGLDPPERRVVSLAAREREELARVLQAGVDPLHGLQCLLEGAALLAELLRLLGVVPDLRVLEGPDDFDQPRLLGVVVKDTSAARPCARRDPGGCSG